MDSLGVSEAADWRAILKAYMHGVLDSEGITFVEDAELGAGDMEALREVGQEVLAERKRYGE